MSPGLKARPLLMCLHGVCSKYRKLYCYPSQKKLLELLARYQGEKKSIATLNRWLRAIEDAGFIKRRRRIRRDRKLGMVFKSTLYIITEKGYHLLAKGGLAVWGILKALANKRVKKGSAAAGDSGNDRKVSGMAPLKNHVARVMKSPLIAEHVGSSK